MVDAELGMPLDLLACPSVFWDQVDPAFNPSVPAAMGEMDPMDAELLENPTLTSTTTAAAAASSTSRIRPEETWLRGTTYMAKNDAPRRTAHSSSTQASRQASDPHIAVPDDSMLAQLQLVEKTFWAHNQVTLQQQQQENNPGGGLRHPLKKNVVAVDTFDVLPDDDVWGGYYNQISLPDRPSTTVTENSTASGTATAPLSNSQLLASVFRPRDHPIRGFQAYAPRTSSDLAAWSNVASHPLEADESRDLAEPDWPVASCAWLKDYEIVDQQKRQEGGEGQVVVLTFSDGQNVKTQQQQQQARAEKTTDAPQNHDDDDDDDDDIFGEKEEEEATTNTPPTATTTKPKGVYHLPLFSRVAVKHLRTSHASYATQDDHWDTISLAFSDLLPAQRARRDEFTRVVRPEWVTDELKQEDEQAPVDGFANGGSAGGAGAPIDQEVVED